MPTQRSAPGRAAALTAGSLLLGFCGGLAAQARAGALGDVLPFVGTVVDLRLAGARVRARGVGTVVLAGLGDAEALFLRLLVGGVGLAHQTKGQHGSEGGRSDQTVVHRVLLLMKVETTRLSRTRAGRLTSGPDHARRSGHSVTG